MSHYFSEPLASFIPRCLLPKKPMRTLAPGCKSPAEPQGAHLNRMIKPLLAVTRSLQYPTHTHVNTATGQTPSCHSEPRVGGARSSSSFSCTCICTTNYFFSLTDKGSFSLCNLTTTHVNTVCNGHSSAHSAYLPAEASFMKVT